VHRVWPFDREATTANRFDCLAPACGRKAWGEIGEWREDKESFARLRMGHNEEMIRISWVE
jgi:hypothetical protein